MEYERLTIEERKQRHAERAWRHEEARLLHSNLLQLKSRASDASLVVDAWFAKREFDARVQRFLVGHLTAGELHAEAKRLMRPTSTLPSGKQ
jgi:hypothetical protein